GFPRNIAQAQALDAMLMSLNQPLDCAVLMDVDFDVLMQRLTGRRTCENCGAAYNIYTNPPRFDDQCDRCGAQLHHRADDNEETIGNRLRVYESQTKPLISFYRQQGRLETVDAVGEVGAILKRLLVILEPIAKGTRKPVLPPPMPVKPGKGKLISKLAPKQTIKPAVVSKAAVRPAAKSTTSKSVVKAPARKQPASKKTAVKKVAVKKVAAVKSKSKKTSGKRPLAKKSTVNKRKTVKAKPAKAKPGKQKKPAAGKKKPSRR
ncbi:MAG: adenylate kinase family protein, partial [Gammaproteobacteria bacterium]